MKAIFLSHASEDKDDVARPLAIMLRKRGYSVWFDEFTLKLGDSLRRSIDDGLGKCDFGIVVLSPAFFAKEWTQKELDALTSRETGEKRKLILPVWHKVHRDDVARASPLLADRLGAATSEGLPKVLEMIEVAINDTDSGDKADESISPVYSFAQQNLLEWRATIAEIFRGAKPISSEWTELDDILEVLGHVAGPNLNHCFLPTGGGLDLDGVGKSLEDGCIELHWDESVISVIKPKSLSFVGFTGFPSMSYFRIETDTLTPISEDIDTSVEMDEELAEIHPLNYQPRWVIDAGYYTHDESGNEVKNPPGTRLVSRYFRGSFVIFAKGSPYNIGLSARYDAYNAQHDKMTAAKFRDFITKIIAELAAKQIEVEPDRLYLPTSA